MVNGYKLILSDDFILVEFIDGVEILFQCYVGIQEEDGMYEWFGEWYIVFVSVILIFYDFKFFWLKIVEVLISNV